MKQFMDFLAGVKMSIVSGLFLAASLFLIVTDSTLLVDPAWMTVLISGLPLLYLAITRLIFQKWISSALLISIAMIASITIGELFAAGEVAFIMAIGAILEDLTVARAKKGISALISLAPQQGRRLIQTQGGIIEEVVSIEQIKKENVLRVLPGEIIPVDGVIVSGNTSVDQSIMTGESLPVDKIENDSVFCGTMNCYGAIDIRATQVGQDSSLQKMIDLVKAAEQKKAPMQKIVDKWAEWLVPIALLIAVIAYIITGDIVRAVTVLVVFCPCALALATPTSIMAAIGQATKHGVLIKSGEALERMGHVNYIAFDKTGTLTHGNLQVSDVILLDASMSKAALISKAAAIEKRSEHPLGKAVVRYADSQGLALSDADEFLMVPGKGVEGIIDRKRVRCGNEAYIKEIQLSITDEGQHFLTDLHKQGKAVMLIAEERNVIGIIGLSDMLRTTAKQVVAKLTSMDTEVVLLTGDNYMAASYIAEQVGIKHIRANLLPAEKVLNIEDLQQKNKNVCMIGDGVNDAPALKMANVSVAMGGMGSDIAIEAADIVLMSDNIEKIPYLKRLSTATLSTIKGNIMASMALNAVAIILSVMGLLNPITGALVHNIGSVLVVLNAALLYDRKFDY